MADNDTARNARHRDSTHNTTDTSGHSKKRSAGGGANGSGTGGPSPLEVIRTAGGQFRELTGLTAESVTSFGRNDEGWVLEVEVTELQRVPDTMSLLAMYEVRLDPEGNVVGYRRTRRYERARTERE